MSETQITTVTDLVSAFGGTGRFAEWLDVVPSTVSNWKAEDAIPSGYHLRLYLECRRRRIKVEPSVFGLLEWPKVDAKSREAAA